MGYRAVERQGTPAHVRQWHATPPCMHPPPLWHALHACATTTACHTALHACATTVPCHTALHACAMPCHTALHACATTVACHAALHACTGTHASTATHLCLKAVVALSRLDVKRVAAAGLHHRVVERPGLETFEQRASLRGGPHAVAEHDPDQITAFTLKIDATSAPNSAKRKKAIIVQHIHECLRTALLGCTDQAII